MASFALSFTSKRDDESGLSAFYNNKTTIIQEARVFNESPISPRKCRALLTRIVYLLYVGETFGTQEATELFFGTTKLFQHKDVSAAAPAMSYKRAKLLGAERSATSRVSGHQGARNDRRGCHHGHQQYHEGHAAEF